MKRFLVFAFFAAFAVSAHAQNWATVSASNITDLNQRPLAAGQICFLVTDQNDQPISVSIGGGGQTLRRPYCSAVTNGAIASFTVPNPASTSPAGIYYRVTVKDTSTGQEVLRYPQVSFSGATFNFDNYAPTNLGSFAPLTGTSVSGNLNVAGNLSVTGTFNAGSLGATSVTSLTDTGAASVAGPATFSNSATFSRTVPTGAAALMPPPSYIDGSSGTGGTGGMLEFTNEVGNTTGYSAWLTQNAFWDGTNWIAPRGTGLSSHGLAVSNHKNFSFNFAASPGTNNSPITWTEWANLGAGGFNLETGNYLINGSQIAFANIAGQSTCAQRPALTGDTTSAAGSCATTLSKIQGTAVSGTTGSGAAVLGTAPSIGSPTITSKFSVSETTTPAGAVGSDVCYGDSTAHVLECSFNNGAYSAIARRLDNLGVFSSTTSAQLAGVLSDETGSGAAVFGTSPTIGTPTVTSPTITTPTINAGVAQGSGVKHQRWTTGICTTAAAAGSTCIFNETWSSPFADSNYTPACTLNGPSNGTAHWATNGWTASSVQIILTSTGLASTYGSVDCIAFHD
jgi:hypothetical protein